MRTDSEGREHLHYTDDGAGDVVLFLHAFPLDGRMWDVQKRELARNARVVVPDLAGFGRSMGLTARNSLDEHADDVAGLLDALAIERASLVGLSMGGYIALAFARRHPKRLAALALADTRAAPDTPEGKVGRDQNIALVEREGVSSLLERMLPKLLSNGASDDVRSLVRALGSSQSPDAVKGALAAMRDRSDSTPLLGQLDLPAAVIVGEADAICPPDEARAMKAALPRATLEIIPGAGHLANLEAPAAFTGAVRRLLAPL